MRKADLVSGAFNFSSLLQSLFTS
jgi:hypothetical protein